MPVQVRIHIIHVGSVTNKGTYALLKAEVSELKRIYGNPEISVSASDVETLRLLEPAFKVCPPLIDIPYERADSKVIRHKKGRDSWTYKFYLIACTILMALQVAVSLISSILVNANIKSLYRSETLKQFKGSDLIVSTADENFKEGSLYLPHNVKWKLAWWSMLFSRMWDIIIAKKVFKKSIVVFPNSVGPFRTKLGRFMARIALNNVDFILLRESYSHQFIEDLKIKTPTLTTSDIAILLKSSQTKFIQGLPKPVIGVSPGLYAASFSEDKQREYISAHSKVLDCVVEKYGVNIVFLPHEESGLKHDDLSFCKMVLRDMTHKDKARMMNAKPLEEFNNYLAELDLLISSRMHPAVLASSDKVPTVVIAYDHKQTGFFNQLGLDNCTIDINQVSFEKLLLKIVLVWDNREKIRRQLALVIPELQNDVRTKIQKVCLRFLPLA